LCFAAGRGLPVATLTALSLESVLFFYSGAKVRLFLVYRFNVRFTCFSFYTKRGEVKAGERFTKTTG
jgi:hypothetical protein